MSDSHIHNCNECGQFYELTIGRWETSLFVFFFNLFCIVLSLSDAGRSCFLFPCSWYLFICLQTSEFFVDSLKKGSVFPSSSAAFSQLFQLNHLVWWNVNSNYCLFIYSIYVLFVVQPIWMYDCRAHTAYIWPVKNNSISNFNSSETKAQIMIMMMVENKMTTTTTANHLNWARIDDFACVWHSIMRPWPLSLNCISIGQWI